MWGILIKMKVVINIPWIEEGPGELWGSSQLCLLLGTTPEVRIITMEDR